MLGLGCFGVRGWWLTWVWCLGAMRFFSSACRGRESLLAEAWQHFQPSCLQKSGAFSAGVCEFQVSSLCH